jgi:hypothetical protein
MAASGLSVNLEALEPLDVGRDVAAPFRLVGAGHLHGASAALQQALADHHPVAFTYDAPGAAKHRGGSCHGISIRSVRSATWAARVGYHQWLPSPVISWSTSALKTGNRSAAAAASRLEESLAPSKIVSQVPGPEHSGNPT